MISTNEATPASTPPLAERVDDLTDIELAAEAAANERISWAVVKDKLDGFCFPLNIDAFIALANPARLLALVTELRGLRARNAEYAADIERENAKVY